jgi:hypothetical protein
MFDHDRYGSISGSFAALLELFYSIEPLGKSRDGRSRGISRKGEGFACYSISMDSPKCGARLRITR